MSVVTLSHRDSGKKQKWHKSAETLWHEFVANEHQRRLL